MKKRLIALTMVVILLLSVFPLPVAAADATAVCTGYSAVGDSICAGFSQPEYRLNEVGFTMDDNVEKSPTTCYTRIVGAAFGVDDLNDGDDGADDLDDTTYNLGKCGCDSTELLRILTDIDYVEDGTNYFELYWNYLVKSDLITLEIGSNDLIMSIADAILACIGEDGSVQLSHKEAMALLEPLLTGQEIEEALEKVTGITLSCEDIEQINAVLTEESLTQILSAAILKFADNFPKILQHFCIDYPDARLVVLNSYNPYPGDSDLSKAIQISIDAINQIMAASCNEAGVLLVDISDTPTNGVDPHPTAAGHAQIASRIINALANTITATADAGGTITPAGQTVVRDNGGITYTIQANKGFDIRDVLVDGVSIGVTDKYTFNNVTADHTITASFRCVMHFDTYAALGDSITAGYALPDYDGEFSNPADGYVAVGAARVTANNTYNDALVAVTSEDVLNILTEEENPYHEQFVQHLNASDLITIDIGSNDLSMTLFDILLESLGYKDVREHYTVKERRAALDQLLDGLSLESLLNDASPEQRTAVLEAFKTENVVKRLTAAYEQFKVNWDEIIGALRDINDDAKLAAIGYYNPYPGLDFTLNGTRYGIGGLLDSFIVPMNTYISEQSAEVGEYVYVSTYAGIELNSTTSHAGTQGAAAADPAQIALFVDPHPTATGHAEIAKRLLDALGNLNPGDPGYPYHPVYIPYYSVEAKAAAGGTVSPSGFMLVLTGSEQKYTFKPDAGYVVDTVTVDGKPVAAAPGYTMKFSDTLNHTLSVTFKKDTNVKGIKDADNPFADVIDSDWFYGSVLSVFVNDIMTGTSSTAFSPNMIVTRGMLVTILYRMENEPEVTYRALFPDVADGEWYSKAVMWAAGNDIVTGYDNGKFGPDDVLTREQLVTILYRYAAYKGYATDSTADLTGFNDTAAISAWAQTAVKWAVSNGLLTGTDTNHLSPLSGVDRASVASLIDRFIVNFWD